MWEKKKEAIQRIQCIYKKINVNKAEKGNLGIRKL